MSGCVESTDTVDLTVSAGILSADVNVSANPGNQLAVEPDGLFAASLPSGTIVAFGAASAPAGWLICDGSPVSRTSFAQLFALIGVQFGIGDGVTTFNLPDLRGRMIAGFAATGGHTDVSTIGNNEGGSGVTSTVPLANRRPRHQTSLAFTQLPSHTHAFSDPGHVHGPSTAFSAAQFKWNVTPGTGVTDQEGGGNETQYGGTTASAVTGITVGDVTSHPAIGGFGGQSASDAVDSSAYIVLNHIIKT